VLPDQTPCHLDIGNENLESVWDESEKVGIYNRHQKEIKEDEQKNEICLRNVIVKYVEHSGKVIMLEMR
jgi:hypothetical protein